MKREGVEENSVPSPSPPVQKILNTTTNKNHNFFSWANGFQIKVATACSGKPALTNAGGVTGHGWGQGVLGMLKTIGARNCSATRMPGSPQDMCPDLSFTGSQAAAVASLQYQQELVFNSWSYLEKEPVVWFFHPLLTKQKSPQHPNLSAPKLKTDMSHPLHTHTHIYIRGPCQVQLGPYMSKTLPHSLDLAYH